MVINGLVTQALFFIDEKIKVALILKIRSCIVKGALTKTLQGFPRIWVDSSSKG